MKPWWLVVLMVLGSATQRVSKCLNLFAAQPASVLAQHQPCRIEGVDVGQQVATHLVLQATGIGLVSGTVTIDQFECWNN